MMSVIRYAIDVVLNLIFVPNTKHGNVVLERNPTIQKHLFAVVVVSAVSAIRVEVQRRPDVAVMLLSFPTGRFAVKVTEIIILHFFLIYHAHENE